MSAVTPYQATGKVQLSDIAEMTGYSLATVSKVLNGRSDVSEKTRNVIAQALQQAGYERRFKTSKNRKLLEVVFQEFDSLWCLEILRGILKEASAHELSVITTESGDINHPSSDWIDGVLRRQPLGVILIFSNLSEEEKHKLSSCQIDYVILDPSGTPSADNLSVQADNWTGGVIATRHLLSLGHRRIGIITGPDNMMCSKARLDGYRAALEEQHVPLDASLVKTGDFKTAGGYAKAMELLQSENRPTAIFGGCDLQALGVYEAARILGLRIPEDLSVVGFDDIQISASLGPAMTTIRQPLTEMAATAVKMIIQQANDALRQRQVVLPTRLVLRDSTQALPTQR